ncbi:MAG: Eco57I restriction-modification methylase domain-containing protein [Eubacteriales bacterium]|nr:Eco57I restriction-modification methylase domain-containing protein [Eubacteriales bacterium]
MIHPARFLFNAGGTPKAWNQKMLNDPHFKVLHYEPDAKRVFPSTDIKGGVAISYRNANENYGAIKTFYAFPELKSINQKVQKIADESFSTIVYSRTVYRFTDKLHEDNPNAINQLSNGHAYDMSTNIFERLPQVFFSEQPQDGAEYIGVYGLEKNDRTLKYIKRDLVNQVENLDYFKVLLPKSNGSGALGEVLSTPLIGQPLIGHTESFISIGCFKEEKIADNCKKYIKSKFCRCLLGIYKVTQDNPPEKWQCVPLEDFTSASDIDWSQPISDIDRQLYHKYRLDAEEIEFVETKVKEMA